MVEEKDEERSGSYVDEMKSSSLSRKRTGVTGVVNVLTGKSCGRWLLLLYLPPEGRKRTSVDKFQGGRF